MIWQAADLRSSASKHFYTPGTTITEWQAFTEGAKAHYVKLDGWLGQHGTKFTAGDSVTVGDFHLFELLDVLEA